MSDTHPFFFTGEELKEEVGALEEHLRGRLDALPEGEKDRVFARQVHALGILFEAYLQDNPEFVAEEIRQYARRTRLKPK